MLILTAPAISWMDCAERFLLDGEVAAGITADPATKPVAISLAPTTPALQR
jgi:hypothetical protein